MLSGRRQERLAEPPSAPLIGGDGPVASLSPEGRYLVYNTWSWIKPIDWSKSLGTQGIGRGDVLGTPALRIHDLTTTRDELLERGAFSVAWRADGALAYARAVDPGYREGEPYPTDVVVRMGVGDPGVVWSDAPRRYAVYGWAGRSLIVVGKEPDGAAAVLAFDGPASARVLAADGGILGVSPDGKQVLLVTGEGGDAILRLVDVADARERAGADDVRGTVAVGGDGLVRLLHRVELRERDLRALVVREVAERLLEARVVAVAARQLLVVRMEGRDRPAPLRGGGDERRHVRDLPLAQP
jgi:hypothetical protein